MIINFIRGFLMAMADSVPGVSGGTIAFILGFYDKFITSLDNLIMGNRSSRSEAIKFLSKLGIGWICGLILSVFLITSIFESHIYLICSLFIGFIVASIPFVFKEEKKVILNHYQNIVFLILGIAIVSLMTYFNPVTSSSNDIGSGAIYYLYVFVAGMIAISAMVLPGISGSTILLIFGLYAPVITAIKEVLTLNFSHLSLLVVFGLGIVTGILVTIRFVKYALTHFRSQTIYMIIGLMIGSIYAIIMGPTTLDIPKKALSLETFNFVTFFIGMILVTTLDIMSKKMEDTSNI